MGEGGKGRRAGPGAGGVKDELASQAGARPEAAPGRAARSALRWRGDEAGIGSAGGQKLRVSVRSNTRGSRAATELNEPPLK